MITYGQGAARTHWRFPAYGYYDVPAEFPLPTLVYASYLGLSTLCFVAGCYIF